METTDIVLVGIGAFLFFIYMITNILESQNKELEDCMKQEGSWKELKIEAVEVLNNHMLKIKFNDGVQKLFDVMDFFMYGSFSNLRDEWYFQNVHIDENGSNLKWDEGEAFSVDMLYVRGE